MKPSPLSALYYPFSRCINEASLKQMLLAFDSVSFLDPVDNEAWRASLFRNLEQSEDPRYHRYAELYDEIQNLLQHGVIRRIDPTSIKSINAATTAAATLGDLTDPEWTNLASNPDKYNLPHMRLAKDEKPSWHAFLSKIPLPFLRSIADHEDLSDHIVQVGGANNSWILTYQAGSASAINSHLAAADELDLAPVTDSELHHHLLILKLLRSQRDQSRPSPHRLNVVSQISRKMAMHLISSTIPPEALLTLKIDEILKFRTETSLARSQLIRDIENSLAASVEKQDIYNIEMAAHQIKNDLETSVRQYRSEMQSIRDKMWPHILSSLNTSLATGGLAALAMTYIAGPAHAVLASITSGSLSILKAHLDLRAERRKLKNSTSPGVVYLSQLEKLQK